MARNTQIAVVGDSNPSAEAARWAEEVGIRLAQSGAVVVCGGLGGIMAAVAQGAQKAGGLTVGILPSYEAVTANEAISITIASGMGEARNILVVASADAVIALPGSHGTLSEVALALKLEKPVIGLRAWADVSGVQEAHTPAEAVARVLAAVRVRL
jgi:uncharacterized protein (TIGR00725 family)